MKNAILSALTILLLGAVGLWARPAVAQDDDAASDEAPADDSTSEEAPAETDGSAEPVSSVAEPR